MKLVLIALLAAVASATSMPTFGKVLGFGTAAYAQDENQGGDSQIDDDPGANGQ
jgi:hypothetical protein